MYKKVNTNMNFVERERETLKFWNDNKIFEQQLALNADKPGYTFYDGPPTANG
ncbi:MAG: class I tRNA ligase family protein, partial [Clostridia bacterium]|nr:class I tRNA ligase family protein [Clostridia bacterium]